jgi:hypothetical protein
MYSEKKEKIACDSIVIYFSQYYLKAYAILSPHRGVSEIQRELVFSPLWILIELHKLIKI